MTKLERLNTAIAHLKGCQKIKNQQDIVNAMGFNKTSISQALKGNEKYLTDSFLSKFVGVYTDINRDWLLKEKGEMLGKNYQENKVENNSGIVGIHGKGHKITNNDIASLIALQKGYQNMISKSQEQIDRLIKIIEDGRKKNN